MREFVGVKQFLEFAAVPSLKREALMFHRIVIPQYTECIDIAEELTKSTGAYYDRNELEWLFDKGIVTDLNLNPDDEKIRAILNNEEVRELLEALFKYRLELILLKSKSKKFTREDFSHLWLAMNIVTRLASILLRDFTNVDAHPILTDDLPSVINSQAKESDVIQIVLNNLPVPNDSTSWEQILEYRSDVDSQHKFLDLRNWMSEVARAKLSPIEIGQKLEYLISQYQRHMELHKMKTNTGTLETYLTIGAEFLEELLHLKPSKAVKALFSLKHKRVELIEGELTSPGREVAYVIKAKEQFSS